MSLRMPQILAPATIEAGQSVLEHEMLAERAGSLSHAGKKAEDAMHALHAGPRGSVPDLEREGLLKAARRAVWAYFIQRELSGFRKHADVIQSLSIPPEVLNRLGEFEHKPG